MKIRGKPCRIISYTSTMKSRLSEKSLTCRTRLEVEPDAGRNNHASRTSSHSGSQGIPMGIGVERTETKQASICADEPLYDYFLPVHHHSRCLLVRAELLLL